VATGPAYHLHTCAVKGGGLKKVKFNRKAGRRGVERNLQFIAIKFASKAAATLFNLPSLSTLCVCVCLYLVSKN
jgi:hypothetical protein